MHTQFVREHVIAPLRSGKYEQVRGQFGRPGTNRRCAIGVILHHNGYESISPSLDDLLAIDRQADWGASFCGVGLTINGTHYAGVMRANESGCTFAQIADALDHECDKQDAIAAAESLVTRDLVTA